MTSQPIPSILMTVGKQYYKLHEYIDEANEVGVSKRIPVQSLPEGLQKGLSKIFLAHPDAIVKVTKPGATLLDLAYRLFDLGKLSETELHEMVDLEQPFWTGEELHPEDFVPERMLDITYALSTLENREQEELVLEFGLKFCMGVIGWSYFTGFEYVLPKGVEELPDHLKHLEGIIEPVHVKYTDGAESTEEDEEE